MTHLNLTCFLLYAIALSAFFTFPVSQALAEDEDKTSEPLPMTGQAPQEMAHFDKALVEFMEKHQVPGLSLAIAKDGKLLYVRGLGYADVENKEPVQPHSLFRIASISKPLTAVAIMQLVEQKKVSLSHKIYDHLRLKPFMQKGDKFDTRWRQITVSHLLHHTGGWDRSKSYDAMFRNTQMARTMGKQAINGGPPAETVDIIRYMMGQPLDFTPGTDFAYSNFGYAMLGRLIERKSGKTYEEYVKDHVLKPIGVTEMYIGGSLESQRHPNEVKYYPYKNGKGTAVVGPDLGKKIPLAYGTWYLESMDSHGGWISSAIDLVRFGVALDKQDKNALLKDKNNIEMMFARPDGASGYDADKKPRRVFYGLGWMGKSAGKGKINYWHGGALTGSATQLAKRHDGITWAFLMNRRRSEHSDYMSNDLAKVLHELCDDMKSWPDQDLFSEYGGPAK